MRLAVNLAPVVWVYGLLASFAWTSQANDVLYPVYHKFVQASRNDDWHVCKTVYSVSAWWRYGNKAMLLHWMNFPPFLKMSP